MFNSPYFYVSLKHKNVLCAFFNSFVLIRNVICATGVLVFKLFFLKVFVYVHVLYTLYNVYILYYDDV